MYQESQEKVLSDVEKHEFNNIKKAFQSRLTNKILLFLMLFGFILTILFGVIYLQRFLNTKIEYQSNLKSHKVVAFSPSTKNRQFYEFRTNTSYPQNFNDYIAKSILVYDINANQKVFSKNSDQQYLIASLTKLASIKILSDKLDENSLTTITKESAQYNGSLLVLKEGDIYTNRDLIKSAIIASNNQALYAMQEENQTVIELNNYAETLRLQRTLFRNPVGFDDDGGNFSTAEEMIPIAKVFFDNDVLKDYAGTSKTEIKELNTNKTTLINNTNELLKNENFPVIAGKTGTTFRAGQNLVLLVEKNGTRYLIVILASTDRYNDAIKILNRL